MFNLLNSVFKNIVLNLSLRIFLLRGEGKLRNNYHITNLKKELTKRGYSDKAIKEIGKWIALE